MPKEPESFVVLTYTELTIVHNMLKTYKHKNTEELIAKLGAHVAIAEEHMAKDKQVN